MASSRPSSKAAAPSRSTQAAIAKELREELREALDLHVAANRAGAAIGAETCYERTRKMKEALKNNIMAFNRAGAAIGAKSARSGESRVTCYERAVNIENAIRSSIRTRILFRSLGTADDVARLLAARTATVRAAAATPAAAAAEQRCVVSVYTTSTVTVYKK